MNAQQSSTFSNKVASNAIDKDRKTYSLTATANDAWWTAELKEMAKIDQVLVYAKKSFFDRLYKNFMVEVGLIKDVWELCKGPYDMQTPIDPHVVTCNSPKIARYIRLSRVLSYRSYIVFLEVEVFGTFVGESNCFYHITRYKGVEHL